MYVIEIIIILHIMVFFIIESRCLNSIRKVNFIGVETVVGAGPATTWSIEGLILC